MEEQKFALSKEIGGNFKDSKYKMKLSPLSICMLCMVYENVMYIT